MHPKVKEIVDQLKPYNPEKIILFGSYAYGKPNENSDVDLVVIKKTDEPFHDRQKKARFFLNTSTPVDIFIFTPEEFETAKKNTILISEAWKKGKIIYG